MCASLLDSGAFRPVRFHRRSRFAFAIDLRGKRVFDNRKIGEPAAAQGPSRHQLYLSEMLRERFAECGF
jgi:hypothetical protein